MKIAIPLADEKLASHFGHCRHFALLSVDNEACPKISKTVVEAPPHEPGLLPLWLNEAGVTHVIAGGLGQKAKELMEARKMVVMTGAPALAPEVLVQQFLAGTLILGANRCDH